MLLAAFALLGCDRLALPGWLPGRTVKQLDGTTQSTPLVVGQVVDAAGRPVAGARVRIYQGLQIRLDGVTQSTPLEGVTQSTPIASTGSAGLDGVTQSTPLDGVTQSTPLDGVTQSTPLEGTTQSTPFDGVTQTTPLQVVGESGPDGAFAIRVPDRSVLSVEASSGSGDKAAILNLAIDRAAHQVDVGRLALDKPGSIKGKVVGPPGLDLAGTAVFVPGTDLVARTDGTGAYEIPGIPARIVAVAAVRPKYRPALARGLTILPGEGIPGPDLLLVPEKPRLDAIEPDNAGPGGVVALRGADFGAAAFTPIEVRFKGLRATRVERTAEGEIVATVPSGAQSGDVVVLCDGVPSNPLPFTVVASVTVSPMIVRTRVEPVEIRIVAMDDSGHAVASPALELALDPPDLGSAIGSTIRPGREGFGRLTVRSGSVSAAADLGFSRWSTAPAIMSDGPRSGPLEGASTEIRFRFPSSVAVRPDGRLLFADLSEQPALAGAGGIACIRELAPDGQVRLVAGTGDPGYDADGLSPKSSRLSRVEGMAVGPAGEVIFTDALNQRVRALPAQDGPYFGRPLSAGLLWNIAGTGEPGAKGYGRAGADGPDALAVSLAWPRAIALHSADSLAVAQGSEFRSAPQTVSEIRTSGEIRTLIQSQASGSENRAENVVNPLDSSIIPKSLAYDADGNLYVGSLYRVWLFCRKAGNYFGVHAEAGQMVAIAGTGFPVSQQSEFSGEEGPALQIRLYHVDGLALRKGSLILADSGFKRIRELTPDGRIQTIAGGGFANSDSSGPAIAWPLFYPTSVAVAPNGDVYFAEPDRHRISILRD